MATFPVRFLVSLPLGLALLGCVTAAPAQPDEPVADPPARVGRASVVEGDVAYLRDGEWAPLPLNWPVTTGTRLSAAPGARAEVRIGSTAVRLAGATELEFARLDDDATRLRLHQGTIDARVRNREVAQSFSVETPEARATLLEPGRYRFDAAPDAAAVGAGEGAARVDALGSSIVVRAGRRAEVSRGGNLVLTDLARDAFDEWALALDRRDDAGRSTRYVSPEMTGYEALGAHGDWREVPAYGPVWVPRDVPADWAPYRTGRWAWIEPWGWTWIDEAPWGFAPFHYGRWALVGGAWAWVPGRIVPRPVYAPALVGWIGRPGWSVTVSIGAVPAVGWFPLAPREVFVPAYRCSTAYVRHANVPYVTNVTNITTQVTNVNYVNRRVDRAVTVVPAAAVIGGQPVARALVPVRRADLDRDGPASHVPPVAAVAPPRPVPARPSRDDDRAPRGRAAADERPARQVERRQPDARVDQPDRRGEVRRPDDRSRGPSAAMPAPPAAPNPPVAQPPTAPAPAAASPSSPRRANESAPVPAAARAIPHTDDRRNARTNERGPAASPRVAETRPGTGPDSRPESRREVRPEPRQEMRPEPRREPQRTEPPRAAPPPSPAIQPQARRDMAPSAPPVARPAPQPQSARSPSPPAQPSASRGDRDRERGPAQGERRGEGRGAG